MTTEQATQMLDLLASIDGKLDMVIWLLAACGLGVGILWGTMTWQVIITAKNQSSLF